MDKSKLILSDKELWEKFLAGDDTSITIIYKKYANDLFTYGLKIVNDESLVKDCIQDVFVRIIDNRRKLVIGAQIHIYLFKSLRNRLFDEIRSYSRKHEILRSGYVPPEYSFDSTEKIIIQEEERTQVQNEINHVIEKLTGKQKEIIYLKYSKDMTYDEIALLLGIDKASVRTLLYRTLKTIREKLYKKALILFLLIKPKV